MAHSNQEIAGRWTSGRTPGPLGFHNAGAAGKSKGSSVFCELSKKTRKGAILFGTTIASSLFGLIRPKRKPVSGSKFSEGWLPCAMGFWRSVPDEYRPFGDRQHHCRTVDQAIPCQLAPLQSSTPFLLALSVKGVSSAVILLRHKIHDAKDLTPPRAATILHPPDCREGATGDATPS